MRAEAEQARHLHRAGRVPQAAVRTSEVGDAGWRTDPGPGECDRIFRLAKQFGGGPDVFNHTTAHDDINPYLVSTASACGASDKRRDPHWARQWAGCRRAWQARPACTGPEAVRQ